MKNETPLKEELTTAMHSEFSVDEETEIRHQVWACCRRILADGMSVNLAAPIYGLSLEQFVTHYDSFLDVSGLDDFAIFE